MSRDVYFGENAHASLFEREAGNFWFRARNKLLLWVLGRYFGQRPGRYLEIGCGTGYVLSAVEAHFPQLELVGSEALAEGLVYARERVKRTTLIQLDARDIQYAGAFELVGAFDVLEHIAEDEQVLAQIHQALAPAGLLLLTVPQHPALWGPGDVYAGHVRRYTRSELRAKLEAAGFEVLRLTSFVAVLLPLMLASRLRQQRQEGPYDPEAEYRLPGLVNRAFEAALDVERAFIRLGVDFPAGGSLLAVARRRDAAPAVPPGPGAP